MSSVLVRHAGRRRRAGFGSTAVLIAMMVAAPGVARAAGPESSASLVEAAQSAAEISGAAPAIATPSDGVDVPERAREGIVVDTTGGEVEMGLPASGDAARIDGAAVFDGAGADNQLVVEPVVNGARAMIAITGADAPAQYRFSIAGATRLAKAADGSVNVYDAAGDALDIPVATIEPAWANDARGNDLQTSYDIDATTLIQTVRFDADAAFPITADPTVSGSCGWVHCTMRLNRAATRNARDAGWLITFAAGACGVVTGGAAAVACAAAIAPAAGVVAVFAGRYYVAGNCLAINFTHPPFPPVAWPSQVKRHDHNCT
jgi:hypothetical protein